MGSSSRAVFIRGIDKCLITFNKRIGIHRESQVSANAPLVLSASDLYMNTKQNVLSLPPFDSLAFSSQDPLYVNKANYNYSIGPGSTVPIHWGTRPIEASDLIMKQYYAMVIVFFGMPYVRARDILHGYHCVALRRRYPGAVYCPHEKLT